MDKLKLLQQVVFVKLVLMFCFFCSLGAMAAQPTDDTQVKLKAPAKLVVDTNEYKEGELLIKFRSITQATQSLNTLPGVSSSNLKPFKFSKSKIINQRIGGWRHLTLPKGMNIHQALADLIKDPNVLRVEPNYRVQAIFQPNDTRFNELWGMNNTGQTGGSVDADIDATQAWDIFTGSSNVIVGVIDTGVDYTHEDLVDNIWTNTGEIPGNNIDDDANGFIDDIHGYDFVSNDGNPMDDNGHGTHVSGTIAASGNNNKGVTGVTWDAQIMGIKFLNSSGSGSISDAVEAISYAVANGAKVLNNSWGGGGFSLALEDAISAANAAGVLFVAAAGNDGRNTDTSPSYPQGYDVPNVISVAATDHRDAKAGFSNYGLNSVDLGAPGVAILSTVPTGSCQTCSSSGYRSLDGTSMAAPHVSGAAALLLGVQTNLSVADLKSILLSSVDPTPALSSNTVSGGRLNVNNAINNIQNLEFSATAVPARQTVLLGNTVDYIINVKSFNDFSGNVNLSLISPEPSISGTFASDTVTLSPNATVSTTLTLATTTDTLRGKYDLVLRATNSAGTEFNANFILDADGPDFDLSLTPTHIKGVPGASVTYAVDVSSYLAYSGNVNLTVATTTNNITAFLSPSSVTVPQNGTAASTLWVFANTAIEDGIYALTINASDGLRNETIVANFEISSIDLTMSDISSGVNAISTGNEFTVSNSVTELGSAYLGVFDLSRVVVYISTDNVISKNDIEIGYWYVYDIGQNETINNLTSVTIPPNTPSGTYYVGAMVDPENMRDEIDENNNTIVGDPITVTRDSDLLNSALTADTNSVSTGANFEITHTVTENGSTKPNSYRMGIYLSEDSNITASDYHAGSWWTNWGGITRNGTDITRSTNMRVPVDMPSGTYFLGAIVDDTNLQIETNENNNVFSADTITIVNDLDLVATSVSTTATQVTLGSTNNITIDHTVTNASASSPGIHYVGLYLSPDPVITNSDMLLRDLKIYYRPPGKVDTRSSQATIRGVAPGTYYLGLIVDHYDQQTEINENNNIAVSGPFEVIN
ncbi:MAG: S8 family serine peptidase [Gammaproteobacteria bacterium]|nr:S8 family serine peptidase [Gammaproteobacteria bacterium]